MKVMFCVDRIYLLRLKKTQISLKGGEKSMQCVKGMSDVGKDFFASFLRSQLVSLQGVLAEIENSGRIEEDYVGGSLRRVEKELHRLRKLYLSN